jgi:peptide subunit release factor 1 (eRF1)
VAFVGCEKCGVAENRNVFRGGRLMVCPDCGQPLKPISLTEAIELVRARAEADEWRAAVGYVDEARRLRTAHR